MGMKEEQLDLVEFKLNGDLRAVSVVTDPAIEKEFKRFNKIEVFKDLKMEVFKVNEEKMELTGVAMTPNKPILRKNEDTGKFFNCWFSEETIKECMYVFQKNGNGRYANFEHDQQSYTDDISVLESWQVIDVNNDKLNSLGFTDITKGDWALTYKTTNKDLWEFIKKEGFVGFSIEGQFAAEEEFKKQQQKLKKMYYMLESSLSDKDKEEYIEKILRTL